MTVKELANRINNGEIGLVPTDTLYGISCSAFNKKAAERIADAKQRPPKMPFIVLMKTIEDLAKFGIVPRAAELNLANKYWPGAVSIVFDHPDNRFAYIHRGTKRNAFRVPDDRFLSSLINLTGPLISTSANMSGRPAVQNAREARNLFKNNLDFYCDAGEHAGQPSTIVEVAGGKFKIIRQGSVLIKEAE